LFILSAKIKELYKSKPLCLKKTMPAQKIFFTIYLLPGLISGSVTLFLTILSLVIRRPMVAWTSYLARRWPLEWYWHPLVMPAYSEVTFAWAVFFAIRLLYQFVFFQDADVNSLAVLNFITGWPATVLLLVVSYLYGTWRLAQLRGPSVQEFLDDSPAAHDRPVRCAARAL